MSNPNPRSPKIPESEIFNTQISNLLSNPIFISEHYAFIIHQ